MNAIPKALISSRTFSVLFLSIVFAFDRSPLQFATSAADSLPSRINPIGIKGTLFLVGGPLTEEILEQVSEVDTDIRHILALQLDSSQQTQQSTRQLLDAWQQHEFVSLEVQKAGKTETDLNRVVQALRETDMVFLLAHDREALEQHLAEGQLRQAIRSVVDREGMIVGENSRDNDMVVNPTKEKKLTNVRAAGSDDNILLKPPRQMTLEMALEYIEGDEFVEVTPGAIRLRKIHLTENARKRNRLT